MSVESVLQRVAAIEQALSNPASLLAKAARTGGTAAPGEPNTAPEPATATGGPSFAEVLQSASTDSPTATSASTANAAYPGTSAAEAAYPGTSTANAAYPGTSTANAAYPSTSYLDTSYPSSAYPGAIGAGSAYEATGVDGLLPTAGSAALAPTPGAVDAAGSMGQRIVAIAESQVGQSEQPPGSNEGPAVAQYRTATAGAIPGAPWCAYFASWASRAAGEPLGAQGEGLGSVAQIWSWAESSGRAIPNGPGVTPQPGDLMVFGDEHVGIVKDVLPNGDIQTIEGNYENKVSANVRTPSEATGYVNMD
jgi:CHAP domain